MSSSFRNYYMILQVEPDATEDEIKASFKRLAKKYHPDVNNEPGARILMRYIVEARDTLLDPEKRLMYDIDYFFNTRVGIDGTSRSDFGFASAQTLEPCASIEEVWIGHGVEEKRSIGFRIYTNFTLTNLRNASVKVAFVIRRENSEVQQDNLGRQMFYIRELVIDSDNEENSYVLFLSYRTFPRETTTYNVIVGIVHEDKVLTSDSSCYIYLDRN